MNSYNQSFQNQSFKIKDMGVMKVNSLQRQNINITDISTRAKESFVKYLKI